MIVNRYWSSETFLLHFRVIVILLWPFFLFSFLFSLLSLPCCLLGCLSVSLFSSWVVVVYLAHCTTRIHTDHYRNKYIILLKQHKNNSSTYTDTDLERFLKTTREALTTLTSDTTTKGNWLEIVPEEIKDIKDKSIKALHRYANSRPTNNLQISIKGHIHYHKHSVIHISCSILKRKKSLHTSYHLAQSKHKSHLYPNYDSGHSTGSIIFKPYTFTHQGVTTAPTTPKEKRKTYR